jgi:TPR repeat protein
MYREGDGVRQDFRQAALYFQSAANAGLVEAQALIGLF